MASPIALLLMSVGSVSSQQAALPDDVIAFIGRRASCEDWIERAKADPAISAQLAATLSPLRCADIPQEETALRERYRGNEPVIGALISTWKRVIRRVPVDSSPSK
jgi:hypothetical protein